jgi:choline dehydrogenase-like flavoprotein
MVWTRGQPQDYDDFARIAPGWGWQDLLPYFRKLENHSLGSDEMRGAGGPIDITIHPGRSALSEAVIRAGEGLGLTRKEDLNRAEQEGIGYLPTNIDARGERVSSARAFLKPACRRSNLTVETLTRVDRVMFTGGRATGVETSGPRGSRTFQATREVILCAGGIASPLLLQRSGVGEPSHLQSLGIPVVHAAAAVGENLREHWLLDVQFRLRDRRLSDNDQFSGLNLVRNALQYLLFRKGRMAWGSHEIGAFVRTSPHLDRPDAQIMYAPYSLDLDAPTLAFEREPGMQIFGYLLRPQSRGRIRIKAPDAAAPPSIEPNYLSHPADRKGSADAIRTIRRLAAQPALAELLAGETAHTASATTDEEIVEAFRRYGQAGYHVCGTCTMGPEGAVVDERLRVRGVAGLRVVDCSVFPQTPSCNTNAPVMAVAWRASNLILDDQRG